MHKGDNDDFVNTLITMHSKLDRDYGQFDSICRKIERISFLIFWSLTQLKQLLKGLQISIPAFALPN